MKLGDLFIFQPGIWRAVECDDAMAVRRLVNQWCNIRVMKVGFLQNLTNISLVSHFWDIGKQCRPRSDVSRHLIRVFTVCYHEYLFEIE